jgi:glutamate/tyrosine decarboxylase-like PLP-dependent enzyme
MTDATMDGIGRRSGRPSPMREDAMKQLLADTAQRAAAYLDSLPARRVAPDERAVSALSRFDVPMPEEPASAQAVLRELDDIATPATTAMAGPRFFGFVIGGTLPAALAANWLATAWDQNTGLYAPTPATAEIERVALGWLVDVLGLPRSCGGGFVTGTTVAHVTALAAARHAVLAKAGWNVEADGLFGAPPIDVVIGAEAHPTLRKALGILGLGRTRVIEVPVDGQGRMRVDALPDIVRPTIVCVQAGNVNTGAFDPVEAIGTRMRAGGAWVHVDGAFGLWARAAPSRAHLAAGVEHADSWATDAHKWLNVPYDGGVALVRDPQTLRAAMSISAEYLPSAGPRNPSDFTPELSRRARGVDVWAALRALGRRGVAELVERNCAQARRFASALSSRGIDILNDVVLNQVLVSFGDAATTNRVIAAIQRDGTCWCGSTVWQGRTAMRISVINWSTTDADVDASVEAIMRVAQCEGARLR